MTTPFDAFGPGIVILTRTDLAVSTPINVGYSQELSVDFSGNIKELHGQSQYPLDAARGTVKVSGKLKAATLSGIAFNTVFFGNNFVTGGIKWNPSEVSVISGGAVTVVNASTFDQDLGVVDSVTGLPYIKVASAPAVGQYSASNVGVYTFNTSDTGKTVLITYTSTVTTGQKLVLANQLIGSSPIFQLDYYTTRNNKALVLRFNQCQASKIMMASKMEDFVMPEFDISMFANSAGNLGTIFFPEIS
jgi:hypothetical protein